MFKTLSILAALILVIALPFVFRQEDVVEAWKRGDPELIIITPHNEAIRYEFGRAFSRWHAERFGQPVNVSWRNIGGTTEINKYLASEFAASARAWWLDQKKGGWPAGATDAIIAQSPPTDDALKAIYDAARGIDDSAAITTRIDLFFGGGEFDHTAAHRGGYTVACETELPPELFATADGASLIPNGMSGETWRTPYLFGNAVSMFGIVYNIDRIKDLGVAAPPALWDDLADFRYFGHVGVADPTKSGSIAKAFEMLVHQKIHEAVVATGFNETQIGAFEDAIDKFRRARGAQYKRGDIPDGVPPEYQAAIERGWLDGVALLQSIGANARYFTDSASKVPVDVSVGDAAVGMAIDFYGRYQAQIAGEGRMIYLTPAGGSSVSCDPISLLRGAPNRKIAVRFIEFTLSEDGQRLWTYEPGSPGGPQKYALRRLPIRRDFYPSTQPAFNTRHETHARYSAEKLADPAVDPYALAQQFTYRRRWTGDHFSVMRDLVKAMCLDSGEELRDAWRVIHQSSPPNVDALKRLHTLPTVTLTKKDETRVEMPLNWRTAPDIRRNFENLEYMREWTAGFRKQYESVK